MRIGIVGSGLEMMPLLQILQQYDHRYELFCDWKYWPWGEKSSTLRQERLIAGVTYLVREVGVEQVIIPPRIELGVLPEDLQQYVLPLFSSYVLDHVLPYSLVGKIGLLCEQVDLDCAEQYIHQLCKNYILTDNQKKTKSFHHSFPLWKKNIRMRTYFLTSYGKRHRMMRKTIKYDLAYFNDAGVDTLIPLSWGCLFYETLIRKRTNRKKIRFHGRIAVEQAFISLVSRDQASRYAIALHTTDTPEILLQEKKWTDMLTRGGQVELDIKDVTL